MPERPAVNASQVEGTLLPTGVTAPRPVITTRFIAGPSGSGRLERGEVGVAKAQRLHVAADTLDQPRQHLARPDLKEGVDSALDHLADRAGPLDWPQQMVV